MLRNGLDGDRGALPVARVAASALAAALPDAGAGKWVCHVPAFPLAEARWRPHAVRPMAEPGTPDAVRSEERSSGVAYARRFPVAQDASVARHDRYPGRTAPEPQGE